MGKRTTKVTRSLSFSMVSSAESIVNSDNDDFPRIDPDAVLKPFHAAKEAAKEGAKEEIPTKAMGFIEEDGVPTKPTREDFENFDRVYRRKENNTFKRKLIEIPLRLTNIHSVSVLEESNT